MERLNEEIISQPDALEKYFCEPFSKLKLVPMTEEQSKIFLRFCLQTEKVINQIDSDFKEANWAYEAFCQRIEGFMPISNAVKSFICYLVEGNIGSMIMYGYYLQYAGKKRGYKKIGLDEFTYIFPKGFPAKDDLTKVWHGQKVKTSGQMRSDNLIDYSTASQSIL